MTTTKRDLSLPEVNDDDAQMVRSVSEIVAAYLSNNPVDRAQIPEIIGSVHRALKGTQEPAAEPQQPAVDISKSVTKAHIICLECGQTFQSLKRHLSMTHAISPEDYRRKWGLPGDYPMVAPKYAEKRSEIAKSQGLGTQPKSRGRKSSQA